MNWHKPLHQGLEPRCEEAMIGCFTRVRRLGRDRETLSAAQRHTTYHKGVTEETTKLVVSDGSQGLESALDYHFYGVPHQRCIFHKIKNLADHLVFEELVVHDTPGDQTAERQARQARKKAILADASAVYAHHEATAIRERATHFRVTWEQQKPEAVEAFFVDFDKTLAS